MITPTFKVDQDEEFIYVTINTPHVRAQDVDLYVEGSEFRFYLRPYFLRLHLPGNVIEDDNSQSTYDPSAGQFRIKITKETKGQVFPDLDLLTKLLARKGEEEKKQKKPLIEVVGGSEETANEIEEAMEFNWEIPQELPSTSSLNIQAYYGFDQQYTGYFTHVQETLNEINDIQQPEASTAESRREERIRLENERFDEDHYCTDFAMDEEIQYAIKYKTAYAKELKKVQNHGELQLQFTAQEEEMMRQLPRKEYLISNEKAIYLGLVDLLFAYSYNHRLTEGEGNVESAWCIGKLSSTMSCLEVNSKRAILKALLDMKYLFDHHDVYYIYSKIYLDDYCVWIQHANENVLRTLAHELHHFKMNKTELGWDLEEIEEIARNYKESEQ
ncbi:hypothetical protein G6F57_012295 [Rhizopus arrhizus]|uniref:CS domain-containing protein n=1 Tax=Rhizopus oryzae TaxID=64495 RepID=A0A9P6X7J3_RHIOR|nr:hypothetical protein G6F23_010939 [Rhizopus arrhizus]KAG1408617.1 hypothetical protein G6F58_009466 [Rhizopus delemar]KAG0762206.1 hypothetical protein G6F24_006975 [Rhizopus arrhizus]KAG0781523.1 hypothetical protein G6F21_011605 [Rhizopus arrhizus]KAG0805541.1 hypothetical protein G6F20_011819 [Rhizopus arrhizus]